MSEMVIDRFEGQYKFLSNFYPAVVFLDNLGYPTVEHAFQMAKTLNIHQRLYGRRLTDPLWVKTYGRGVTLRPDWDKIKLDVMFDLVTQKFMDPELDAKLRATGEAQLIEGNYWNDKFWGVCKGVGENHLGKILMEVRASLPL